MCPIKVKLKLTIFLWNLFFFRANLLWNPLECKTFISVFRGTVTWQQFVRCSCSFGGPKFHITLHFNITSGKLFWSARTWLICCALGCCLNRWTTKICHLFGWLSQLCYILKKYSILLWSPCVFFFKHVSSVYVKLFSKSLKAKLEI